MGPPRQSGPLALDPGKLLGVILPQQGPAPNSCSRSCLGSALEHEPAQVTCPTPSGPARLSRGPAGAGHTQPAGL